MPLEESSRQLPSYWVSGPDTQRPHHKLLPQQLVKPGLLWSSTPHNPAIISTTKESDRCKRPFPDGVQIFTCAVGLTFHRETTNSFPTVLPSIFGLTPSEASARVCSVYHAQQSGEGQRKRVGPGERGKEREFALHNRLTSQNWTFANHI